MKTLLLLGGILVLIISWTVARSYSSGQSARHIAVRIFAWIAALVFLTIIIPVLVSELSNIEDWAILWIFLFGLPGALFLVGIFAVGSGLRGMDRTNAERKVGKILAELRLAELRRKAVDEPHKGDTSDLAAKKED